MVDENKIKKAMSMSTKVILGLLAIILIPLILYGGVKLINALPEGIKSVGATKSTTPLNVPEFLKNIVTVGLGSKAVVSWENLVLYLAIFFMLFFALSDIVMLFSTFTDTTSWVMGFGLAIVAGVTKTISWIAGIFAITAGIGAVGIAIIIIMAVLAAVVLNMGIRGPLMNWRQKRQTEIDSFKAGKGFGQVADFITGARQGTEAATS